MDATDAVRAVFFIMSCLVLLFYAGIGLYILSVLRKASRLVQTILVAVNKAQSQPIHIEDSVLTRPEADEIRAFIRMKKAQEARDYDTIDKAEGFGNDL